MYGEKLKKIRKTLSLTQEEMAKLIDISYRTYVSYERNENNPPYSMLIILCKKYKINLNWFIADEGQMQINVEQINKNSNDDEFIRKVDEVLKKRGLII